MESSEKDNIHVFRINRERPNRERSVAPVAHLSKSSKSRTSISGGTKRLICEDHMRNPRCTQEELATKYGCKRTTIAKIIKGKERWLLIDSDVTAKRFRQRNSRYPVIEDALLIWIQKEQQENSTVITDQMLQSQARMYAQTCEKDAIGFKASSSWLSKFKQRYLNGESTITTTTTATTTTENDSEKGSNSASSSPSSPHIATDTTTDTIRTIPATLSAIENTDTSTPSPNHVYHDTQSLAFTSREAEAPSQAIDNLNKNMTECRYHLTLGNNDTHGTNERHTSPSQLPASSIIASPVPETTATTATTTTHLLEQQQQQQQQQEEEEQEMRDDEEMGDITGGYSPWQSDDDDNEQDNTRIEKDQARQHLEAALSYYTSQHQASSMSAELIRLILQKDF